MGNHFPANLRRLVNSYGSISEFCRAVDINRQQFNKYLGGRSMPSPRNLRRICDHAGISESDLFRPGAEFRLRGKTPEREQRRSALFSFIEEAQRASGSSLKRYGGVYYKYYYSLSQPGLVRKSLLSVSVTDSGALTKCVEPAGKDLTRFGMASLCKYSGEAIFLGDRLFLLEYEYLSRQEISYSIYFPSYMANSLTLPGLMLGVSAGNRRDPAATRVLLTRLEDGENARTALRSCGLFDPDSGKINRCIRDWIDNSTAPEQSLFLARTLEHMKVPVPTGKKWESA